MCSAPFLAICVTTTMGTDIRPRWHKQGNIRISPIPRATRSAYHIAQTAWKVLTLNLFRRMCRRNTRSQISPWVQVLLADQPFPRHCQTHSQRRHMFWSQKQGLVPVRKGDVLGLAGTAWMPRARSLKLSARAGWWFHKAEAEVAFPCFLFYKLNFQDDYFFLTLWVLPDFSDQCLGKCLTKPSSPINLLQTKQKISCLLSFPQS